MPDDSPVRVYADSAIIWGGVVTPEAGTFIGGHLSHRDHDVGTENAPHPEDTEQTLGCVGRKAPGPPSLRCPEAQSRGRRAPPSHGVRTRTQGLTAGPGPFVLPAAAPQGTHLMGIKYHSGQEGAHTQK